MAFRREVLREIGGFDPLFGPGSLVEGAEDLDAAGRARVRSVGRGNTVLMSS